MEVPKEQGFVTLVEGNLLKKVLKEGEGPSPTKDQEVSALYKGTLTDGTEFDSNEDRESPFSFTLGVGRVIKCWDEGFVTMKRGERAVLVCSPAYGYGESGSGKIPANATLRFEVELLDFKDKKREKHELTEAEKVEEAAKLKDQGNEHFKAGRNKEAAASYAEAIEYLEDIDTEEAGKLKQVSHLNAAMAYLRTKQYSKAIENATNVLKKDPNNPKALFRRGVAYLESQDFDKSKADLELLSKNEPDNAQAKKELAKLRVAQGEARKKEKKVFGKIFSSNYYEDMKPEQKKEDPADYKKIESEESEEEEGDKQLKKEEKQEVKVDGGKVQVDATNKMEVQEPTAAQKVQVQQA